MYELRRQFPVLNDGYELLTLSNRTYNIYLPGGNGLVSNLPISQDGVILGSRTWSSVTNPRLNH